MTEDMTLIERIEVFVDGDDFVLPVFSSAAVRVQRELAKKEPDVKALVSTITGEQALSTKVLQIANSSFYKGLNEVKTVQAATVRLGLAEIGRISLLACTKNQFRSRESDHEQVMRKLWQHSVGCAMGAKWLTQRCDMEELTGEAFFAGLFHDIGKLVVLMVIEQIKRQDRGGHVSQVLLLEAMETLHCLQGYNLMKKWNIPDKYCQIARDHHCSQCDVKDLLLCVVKVANMVCNKLGIGVSGRMVENIAATTEVMVLNLTELDLAELEIFLEDSKVLAQ